MILNKPLHDKYSALYPSFTCEQIPQKGRMVCQAHTVGGPRLGPFAHRIIFCPVCLLLCPPRHPCSSEHLNGCYENIIIRRVNFEALSQKEIDERKYGYISLPHTIAFCI